MAFVKLDCGILNSTIWFDRPAREVFLTALLMAEPREFAEPQKQIEIRSLKNTGWAAPPGWYGFVGSSSHGIIARSGVDDRNGREALERLGAPEKESRSQDHQGRRMIRIDGGFLILNFIKYRERDHTAAERARRYRENKASRVMASTSRVTSRSVTQAEAEAEAEADTETERTSVAVAPVLASWSSEACDDWLAKFGGSAPGGRIGKALKPLVKKYGWPTIRPAWKRYLAKKDPEFVTPQDFASKLGPWLHDRVATGKGQQFVDRTRSVLSEWLKEREHD